MRGLTYVAAAAIAVGAAGITGCKDDSSGKSPGQKAGEAVQGAVNSATQGTKDAKDSVTSAVAPSGAKDLTGVRGTLEGVVQNALDANNFKDLTSHLTDADKKRIDGQKPDTADLDAGIKQFRKSWGDKFGGDNFTSMDKDKIFAEPFVALADAPAAGNQKGGTATIKGSHGMPDLTIPVVTEDGKWRIDVPDTVTGHTLHDSLMKVVQDLNKDPSTWPADKIEATRLVSHKVLMAVLGQ
jgi:hypothetical protein